MNIEESIELNENHMELKQKDSLKIQRKKIKRQKEENDEMAQMFLIR